MKKYVIAMLLMLLLFVCIGCTNLKYDEDEIIGLNSNEVVEKYGKFDLVGGFKGDDGIYRKAMCGYTVKEKGHGLLGLGEEEFFVIHFNEDGIAYECSYLVGRPGG